MPVLHEVIPAREELKGERRKLLDETGNTFGKKTEHFRGHQRDYVPFDESAKDRESEVDRKELDTTVRSKLDYLFEHLIKYWDASAQVDATNQVAKADILVNGRILVAGVPATLLLAMEGELKDLRAVLGEIPTLPPGRKYERDAALGPNIWRQVDADVSFKQAKVIQSKILVQPTKEHPAQIEKWTEALNVGKYSMRQWFGMLSPSEKSELLGRLDELSRAVKAARQRANTTDVVPFSIGAAIRDYLLDGK